jgi:DNA-binding transcriptional MocR family regulator
MSTPTTKREGLVLEDLPINPALGKDYNNMFSFLNDTAARYPRAISLVAGMPDESFFDVEGHMSALEVFVDYVSATTGKSKTAVIDWIAQYNSSRGLICDILAKYLACDEDIHVTSRDIMVTIGAQEAFAILVSTLCTGPNDVILMESPSYIGLSAAAKLLGFRTQSVSLANDGIDLEALENKLATVSAAGSRVKMLYTIPDYQNPSGYCMSVEKRLALLKLAKQHNFLLVEDSVYNSFSYNEERNPTLKSLDKENRVIYVGSFSKLLFPGLRMGMIVADQKIRTKDGSVVPLMDELEKVKGAFTNNSPGITQAMLAGVLVREQFSLRQMNAPKINSYCQKRDALLAALNKFIQSYSDTWAAGISWNKPEGGFFIKISLPFDISNNDVLLCAEQYGVLFCPMAYFYLDGGGHNEIRLAFSKCTPVELEEGVKRLANFFRSKAQPQQPLSLVEHNYQSNTIL